jgi:hypothetical protein
LHGYSRRQYLRRLHGWVSLLFGHGDYPSKTVRKVATLAFHANARKCVLAMACAIISMAFLGRCVGRALGRRIGGCAIGDWRFV